MLPSVKDVGGALDYYQWTALLRSVSVVRDLPHAVPRPDPPDQGRAAADPRAPHAALARRLLRPDHAGDGAHRRGSTTAPRRRLASELHARLTNADIEEIFQDGLHEYLTECIADMQRARRRASSAPTSATALGSREEPDVHPRRAQPRHALPLRPADHARAAGRAAAPGAACAHAGARPTRSASTPAKHFINWQQDPQSN